MSFKSYRGYYIFMNSVCRQQRYIMNEESIAFLESIIETCHHRVNIIKSGTWVWRAQIGSDFRPIYQTDPETDEDIHVDDAPIPFSSKRMKPLPDSASEGRANPKGIPCLYVATDKETAMSEVRPWLNATISVGRFRVARDLKILDFSVAQEKRKFHIYLSEPDLEKRIEAVWSDIDKAFSRPTKNSDIKSDYAPTQIISEFVKSKGYDGIAYKSSFSKGHNIALFDLNSATMFDCKLYEASEIKFNFNEMHDFDF